MTAPLSDALTDDQLADIRALKFLDAAITDFDRACAAVAETRKLVREVDRLRAVLANAEKLVAGWRHDSDDHALMADGLERINNDTMASRQSGRSVQLADCASELEGVLQGEDPDGWEHGIEISTITPAAPTD